MAERRFPQGIWSPKLEQLSGSDAVATAMSDAARSAKDRGIAEGLGAFNTGVRHSGGTLIFSNSRGARTSYPDLRFWDYTQRELQDAIGAAQRAGRNEEAGRLISLRRQLVDELDRAVPEFQDARGVAARYFKVEAGERFVTMSEREMSDPAAARAVAQMSPPERAMFARAFAAQLANMLEHRNYSADVLNNMFVNSPRALRRIRIALGHDGADEFEALMRVEGLVDQFRRAQVGNSSTRQQFHDTRLIGTTAALETLHGGINPVYWIAAPLIMGGIRAAHRIDEQVMIRVAEMLLSPDTARVQRALQIVTRRPVLRDALRQASNISVRELLNAAGPTGVLAGGAAGYHHFFPGGTPHAPEAPRQGSYDDQYDYDRAGSGVP
jgi:hypothetical protein